MKQIVRYRHRVRFVSAAQRSHAPNILPRYWALGLINQSCGCPWFCLPHRLMSTQRLNIVSGSRSWSFLFVLTQFSPSFLFLSDYPTSLTNRPTQFAKHTLCGESGHKIWTGKSLPCSSYEWRLSPANPFFRNRAFLGSDPDDFPLSSSPDPKSSWTISKSYHFHRPSPSSMPHSLSFSPGFIPSLHLIPSPKLHILFSLYPLPLPLLPLRLQLLHRSVADNVNRSWFPCCSCSKSSTTCWLTTSDWMVPWSSWTLLTWYQWFSIPNNPWIYFEYIVIIYVKFSGRHQEMSMGFTLNLLCGYYE